MTALTCLADLLVLRPDDKPRREQRAWVTRTLYDDKWTSYDKPMPAILQGTLRRTAVVRLLPDDGVRYLAPATDVLVEAETLAWQRDDMDLWTLGSQFLPGQDSNRERRARGRAQALSNRK